MSIGGAVAGDRGEGAGRSPWPARAALAALLLVGALVRLGGAWIFRHSNTADQGIVALMAKHIAEGKDFPVFFYGQAYMGSLEPAVSALLCRIFGYSGFAVCLGTALVGFLLLPLVYVASRDIAGRGAGLAAVAFCIVGPPGFWHYLHSPRGGYAVTLVLGVLLPWHAGRLALRLRRGERAPGAQLLLLGLAGGIGWWSNQLISPALLGTGLMFLLVLGRRAIGWHLLPAAGGFVFGSLPFWVWNLARGWQSLAFVSAPQGTSVAAGARLFLTQRLPAILDAELAARAPAAGSLAGRLFGTHGPALAAAAYAIPVAAALVWYARRLPRARWDPASVQLTGLLLSTGALFALFSSSAYAMVKTPRYLLPLVPTVGVLVGVGTARLARGARRGLAPLAALPLVALLAWQGARTADVFGPMYRDHEAFQSEALRLGADLRADGPDVMYAPYKYHALNAALAEEFCFVDPKGERYAPYAERAEHSDRIGVLDNFEWIKEFLRTAGGKHRETGTGRFWVAHGFEPPAGALAALPGELWASATDQTGADLRRALTDGDDRSRWLVADEEPASLRVGFAAPVDLAMLRIVRGSQPVDDAEWEILGRSPGAGDRWVTLLDRTVVTPYWWSGSRPYCGGGGFRLEARFPTARVDQIVVRFWGGGDEPLEVAELLVYAPGAASRPTEAQALPDLAGLLAERRAVRLYGDRWVANAIYRSSGGSVRTPREGSILAGGEVRDEIVVFGPATALLAREENAPLCRATLAGAGVTMRESPVGPWVLFDFAPEGTGGWREAYRGVDSLRWAGFACLSRDPTRPSTRLAGASD